jgi:hypothetical protein
MSKARKDNSQKKRSGALSKGVGDVLSGKFLTREYVQSNLTFIIFLVFVMVCYIGYGYFAEKNLKDLKARESELRELKARHLSTNARLEQLKQQSQVAHAISELGLIESTNPPTVIRVEETDLSETENE